MADDHRPNLNMATPEEIAAWLQPETHSGFRARFAAAFDIDPESLRDAATYRAALAPVAAAVNAQIDAGLLATLRLANEGDPS